VVLPLQIEGFLDLADLLFEELVLLQEQLDALFLLLQLLRVLLLRLLQLVLVGLVDLELLLLHVLLELVESFHDLLVGLAVGVPQVVVLLDLQLQLLLQVLALPGVLHLPLELLQLLLQHLQLALQHHLLLIHRLQLTLSFMVLCLFHLFLHCLKLPFQLLDSLLFTATLAVRLPFFISFLAAPPLPLLQMDFLDHFTHLGELILHLLQLNFISVLFFPLAFLLHVKLSVQYFL